MPKKGKRGQKGFSRNSSSNRSQRNGGYRRHDVRADAFPAAVVVDDMMLG